MALNKSIIVNDQHDLKPIYQWSGRKVRVEDYNQTVEFDSITRPISAMQGLVVSGTIGDEKVEYIFGRPAEFTLLD